MQQIEGKYLRVVEDTIADALKLPSTRCSRDDLMRHARAASSAAIACDKDKSGTLSTIEAEDLCRVMGLPLEDGDDAIYSMDADGSGSLDIAEFIAWWIKRCAAVPGTYIQSKKVAAVNMDEFEKETVKETIEVLLKDPSNLASELELQQQAAAAYRTAKSVDHDGNGIITVNEVEDLCERMALPIGDGANDVILNMDDDGSGNLQLMEFVVWWIRRVSRLPGTHKQQEVIARSTFRRFDIDQSGTISISELGDLTANLGVEFSPAEMQEAMVELDSNKSGSIDENEFIEWWVNRTNSVRPGASLIAYKLKKLANKAAQVFYTDIHTAAWKGDLELVKMFLDATPELCNAGDVNEHGEGWTPLQYAAYQGHINVVSEILSRKGDKSRVQVDKTNQHGFTALFYAAQRHHLDIVELLLDAGADPAICGSHHIDPDIRMCPADHIQDCRELLRVFKGRKNCDKPTGVNPKDINISINTNGLVVLEFPSSDAIRNISKLPLVRWRVRLSPVEDMSQQVLQVSVPASRAVSGQRQKVEFELDKDEVEMFLESASKGQFRMCLSASNAMGEGPVTDPIEVVYNKVTPRYKKSSSGAAPSEKATASEAKSSEKERGAANSSSRAATPKQSSEEKSGADDTAQYYNPNDDMYVPGDEDATEDFH